MIKAGYQGQTATPSQNREGNGAQVLSEGSKIDNETARWPFMTASRRPSTMTEASRSGLRILIRRGQRETNRDNPRRHVRPSSGPLPLIPRSAKKTRDQGEVDHHEGPGAAEPQPKLGIFAQRRKSCPEQRRRGRKEKRIVIRPFGKLRVNSGRNFLRALAFARDDRPRPSLGVLGVPSTTLRTGLARANPLFG